MPNSYSVRWRRDPRWHAPIATKPSSTLLTWCVFCIDLRFHLEHETGRLSGTPQYGTCLLVGAPITAMTGDDTEARLEFGWLVEYATGPGTTRAVHVDVHGHDINGYVEPATPTSSSSTSTSPTAARSARARMDDIIATRTTPQLFADLAELDTHRNRGGYLLLKEERIVGAAIADIITTRHHLAGALDAIDDEETWFGTSSDALHLALTNTTP